MTDTQADLTERARALVTEMQDACGIYHTSMIGRIAAFAAEARRAALEECDRIVINESRHWPADNNPQSAFVNIHAAIRALASPAPQEKTRAR